jgi:hypothetical protein
MEFILSRLRVAVFSLLLCSGIGTLLFLLLFGSALNQEKDTADILKSVFSMELNRATVAPVNSSQKRLLVKDFSALKTYLEEKGWTWTDQMGAFVKYHKKDQYLDANCGMYSRNYMICDLNQTP